MRSLLPLLALLLLTGCGPQIEVSTPVYSNAQESGVIHIAIRDGHNQVGRPQVLLFPRYQPTQIQQLTADLQQDKPDEFSLTLPALTPDAYRIVMKVPYAIRFAGIRIGSGTRWTVTDFVIHQNLPASCFRFDDQGHDLMGWTSHGVYITNRDKPVSKETCPGLFYINSSWPYPLNDNIHGGSLFVPVSSDCFPKTSPQLSEPSQWTFAFVSPDLRERASWQQLHAIRFHMATRSINVSVQPEIQYERDNKNYSYTPDAQVQSHFDVSGGRWNNFEYPFKLPDDARLTHIVIHVYGVPEKTVSDQVDSIYLDAVCPVK